jgi:hypothetical protein
LERVTSLQSLNLSWCEHLSNLSPLASLTSLQSINLGGYRQLSDLSPLAGLISLQELNLSICRQLGGNLSPLASLATLQSLDLSGCKRLSGDLTSLAGLISLESLHLSGCKQLSGDLSPLSSLTSLKSLALFLHGQAIFLLLWTPELERSASYEENGVLLRHRPLSYWLDYLRAFAGTDASVLILQSQCDTREKRILHPPATTDDFPFHRSAEVSSRTGLNIGILKEYIKEAVRDRFNRIVQIFARSHLYAAR